MTTHTSLFVLAVLLAASPAYAQIPYQPLSRQPGGPLSKGYAELDALGMLCSIEVSERARAIIAPDLHDFEAWRRTLKDTATVAQRAAQDAQAAKTMAEMDSPLKVTSQNGRSWVTSASVTTLGVIYSRMVTWRRDPRNPHRVPDYAALAGVIFGNLALNCHRRELHQRGFVEYAPGTCSLNGVDTFPGGGALLPHPRVLYGFIAQRCSYQPGAPRGTPPVMVFIPARIGDPFKVWPVPPTPSAPPPLNAGLPPTPAPPPAGVPPPSTTPPPKEDPSLADRLLDLAIEKAATALVDAVDDFETRRREMGNIPFLFEELRALSVTSAWGLGFVDRALKFLKLDVETGDFMDTDSYARWEARQSRLDFAYGLGLDCLLTPEELATKEQVEYWEQRAAEHGYGAVK